MQDSTVKIIFFFLMLGYAHSISAHVALDYPQGGETFIEGEIVTIQWHIVAPHVTLNWDLYFSSDGGDNWAPIQLDIPLDSLSYTWHVPSIATSQGKVRIIQDNQGQDYLATTMDFSIVPNTSPPSLDAPANDIIIECGMGNPETTLQSWLEDHGDASVTNHCGQLNWTNDYFQLTNNCGNTGDAIVTFTASDECGSTYTVASVYFIDSIPPIMEVPPMRIVVECDGHGNLTELNAWLANQGGAQAVDACGNVVWTNDLSSLLQQCGATGSTIVSFAATDECGNSVASTAMFTIVDRLAPEIIGHAQDLILDCGTLNEQDINQWLENHGEAQAIDLCGAVHWAHNYTSLNYTCGSSGNAIVTFTVSDDCGNVSFTSAMLRIEDHLAPVINQTAQDNTIFCGSFNPEGIIQSWIEMHGGAVARDNCGVVNWTNNYEGLNDGCGITGSAMVIFTASDECGNGSTTSAILSLIDQAPPVIDVAAKDTSIECGSPDQDMIIQQWLDQHGGASAHDECGDVIWLHDFSSIEDNCDTSVNYSVTFIVVDECGNSNFTTATFTIQAVISSNASNLPEDVFILYPNPVDEILTLELGDCVSSPVNLTLNSADGKLLWSGNETNDLISIPMTVYASGVYFLRIRMKDMTHIRTVIKR